MKSKDARYEEAVNRNLEDRNLPRWKNRKNVSLNEAKTILGIRKDDDRFDGEVSKFLARAKAQ